MKKEIHKLNVIYFYDKGYYIAYLPHFNIIISEYKKRRVRKVFEMIKDYTINHCKEIGSFKNLLIEYGWKKEGNKFIPPTHEYMMKDNDIYRDMIEKENYKTFVTIIKI